MADVRPFRALRPADALAGRVIAPPYDVLTLDECHALAADPLSFVHVTRSEVDLPPGADATRVFRIAATVGVLAHAFSNVHDSIWKGVTWGTTLKFAFDGVVYALVTGATFAWLWPAAA